MSLLGPNEYSGGRTTEGRGQVDEDRELAGLLKDEPELLGIARNRWWERPLLVRDVAFDVADEWMQSRTLGAKHTTFDPFIAATVGGAVLIQLLKDLAAKTLDTAPGRREIKDLEKATLALKSSAEVGHTPMGRTMSTNLSTT